LNLLGSTPLASTSNSPTSSQQNPQKPTATSSPFANPPAGAGEIANSNVMTSPVSNQNGPNQMGRPPYPSAPETANFHQRPQFPRPPMPQRPGMNNSMSLPTPSGGSSQEQIQVRPSMPQNTLIRPQIDSMHQNSFNRPPVPQQTPPTNRPPIPQLQQTPPSSMPPQNTSFTRPPMPQQLRPPMPQEHLSNIRPPMPQQFNRPPMPQEHLSNIRPPMPQHPNRPPMPQEHLSNIRPPMPQQPNRPHMPQEHLSNIRPPMPQQPNRPPMPQEHLSNIRPAMPTQPNRPAMPQHPNRPPMPQHPNRPPMPQEHLSNIRPAMPTQPNRPPMPAQSQQLNIPPISVPYQSPPVSSASSQNGPQHGMRPPMSMRPSMPIPGNPISPSSAGFRPPLIQNPHQASVSGNPHYNQPPNIPMGVTSGTKSPSMRYPSTPGYVQQHPQQSGIPPAQQAAYTPSYPQTSHPQGPAQYQNSSYAGGNVAAPQPAAPKVNPAAIPSVVSVLEADESRFKESGQPFYTFSSIVENPPPLPTTRSVSIVDDGNSSPQYIRSTLNHVPISEEVCENSKIPLGLLIQPFAASPQSEVPLADFGEAGPLRCNRCRAYINPHVQFIKGGRYFVCNLCDMSNEVPEEYYANLDMSGKRIDLDLRPELKYGTVDFVASKVLIFLCKSNLNFLFLFRST
jgi:protein transport protein SEC24